MDYDIRWQELKDSLRRAGNCKTCTINTDEKTRKSKGFGQAVFETPMEALTCIATFNGYEMGRDRRAIVVRLVNKFIAFKKWSFLFCFLL